MLLVVQSTSIVLLMRYSRTRPAAQDNIGPPYLASAAVLMAEVLKLPVCTMMAAYTLGGLGPLCDLLRTELFGSGFADTLKCSIPAMAFTVQGNLLFVALENLEAPTYQVSYQCKTLFTALFSVVLLGRQLKQSQWVALVLLVAGTVLVSDPFHAAPKKETGKESFAAGIASVLGAALLSASSSVYFEMMLKKAPSSPAVAAASLWLRNIQLGIFATPLAGIAMLLKDGAVVGEYGALHGFDSIVWAIVVLNGVGGLLVAATMKYADNIAKCFAVALAIVSGTLLAVPLFDFTLSSVFGAGAICTVVASTIFSLAPDRLPLIGGASLGPRSPSKAASAAKILEELESAPTPPEHVPLLKQSGE
jgi:UDP-sugar transporter A1/2/3